MAMSSTSSGVPEASRAVTYKREDRRRPGDAQELGFLAGRVPGGDLLQDVINPGGLAPGQVRADAAVQRVRAGQIGPLGQRGGHPPGDDLGRLAVLAHQAPAAQHLLVRRGTQQRGDPGRRNRHARLDQLPGLARLIAVQFGLADAALIPARPARGGRGRKLPLPCWVSIQPSLRSTRSARTTVGRAMPNSSVS